MSNIKFLTDYKIHLSKIFNPNSLKTINKLIDTSWEKNAPNFDKFYDELKHQLINAEELEYDFRNCWEKINFNEQNDIKPVKVIFNSQSQSHSHSQSQSNSIKKLNGYNNFIKTLSPVYKDLCKQKIKYVENLTLFKFCSKLWSVYDKQQKQQWDKNNIPLTSSELLKFIEITLSVS